MVAVGMALEREAVAVAWEAVQETEEPPEECRLRRGRICIRAANGHSGDACSPCRNREARRRRHSLCEG